MDDKCTNCFGMDSTDLLKSMTFLRRRLLCDRVVLPWQIQAEALKALREQQDALREHMGETASRADEARGGFLW